MGYTMKLISGSSNLPLARQIGQQLGIELSEVELSTFPNGEKRVWVKDSVQGHNIVLVQSFSEPSDEHIMEFLLLSDALERLGARHVNLVLPWMGYSLQDKVFRDGEPIAAKVVANLVSNAYIKRVFVLDLHNSSTPGFFSIPTQHLSAIDLFAEYARANYDLSSFVVASPDFGGLKRARVFAEKIGVELINIDKHRDLQTGQVTAMGVHGEVANKSVIVFDDTINGGSTVTTSAAMLKESGAQHVHFFSTHGPLVKSAFANIENSPVDSVVITNSIAHEQLSPKFKVIDVAPLFATELKTWSQPAS
jgi:ribose-phosphate pyrophosphokinase